MILVMHATSIRGGLSKFTVCAYICTCLGTFLLSTYSPSHRMAAPVVQAAVDEDAGCGAGDRPRVCSGGVCGPLGYIPHHLIFCTLTYMCIMYIYVCNMYVCMYTVELIVGLSLSHLMCSQRCARDVDVF